MSDPGYTYVDTQPALDALVKRLKKAPRVALDTEGNSLYEYRQKVCLFQLHADGGDYIVDPLADVNLDDFIGVLAGKPLVFHAGDYDLRLLNKTYTFIPKKDMFDTMIAAQLLGCERVGLVNVAEEFLGVELTKSGQKSNWTRRPLSAAQLEYAANDTRHLLTLADTLHAELDERGRIEWHREACRRVVASALNGSAEPKRDTWRIRGAGLLKRPELAHLKALWHWRDKEAHRANVPAFKILGNQQLLEWAKWCAANPSASIKKGPGLPRSCSGKRYDAFEKTVRQTRALPREKYPPLRERRVGGVNHNVKTDRLKQEVKKVADELNMPLATLAPQAALTAIVAHRPKTLEEIMEKANLMHWQAKIVQPVVDAVIHRKK